MIQIKRKSFFYLTVIVVLLFPTDSFFKNQWINRHGSCPWSFTPGTTLHQTAVLGFGWTSDGSLSNQTISVPWPKGSFRAGIGPKGG